MLDIIFIYICNCLKFKIIEFDVLVLEGSVSKRRDRDRFDHGLDRHDHGPDRHTRYGNQRNWDNHRLED